MHLMQKQFLDNCFPELVFCGLPCFLRLPQYPTRCRREGLKRQQAAALTNFVGCFLLPLSYFFFSPFSDCAK